jgi:hypothetical protein
VAWQTDLADLHHMRPHAFAAAHDAAAARVARDAEIAVREQLVLRQPQMQKALADARARP